MSKERIVPSPWRLLPPIHGDGHKFFAVAGVGAVAGFFVWTPLGWLGLLLAAALAAFFRNPQRRAPVGSGRVLAPSDGLVTGVEMAAPPPELEMASGEMRRASIFLSVLDCHVTRSPADGTARRMRYRPGRFFAADKETAGEENERRSLLVENAEGGAVVCVQIAGALARRIVTHVEVGDVLHAGERIGLIRFGSRVDVYFDPSWTIRVGVGQRVVGGETIVAEAPGAEAPAQFAWR